jgi:hypothetical protein
MMRHAEARHGRNSESFSGGVLASEQRLLDPRNWPNIPSSAGNAVAAHLRAMGKYEKKRKIYNVTYEVVDPLLPEMRKKLDLAFDILFDAVLKEGSLPPFTHPSDSTEAPRSE